MEKISVVIITCNEEKNIARCISSVKEIADEVVVLDSFSTDNTITIAKEMGALVFQDAFAGYVAQKNKALSFCAYNYVLSLDADEALGDKLIRSIKSAKKNLLFEAYRMNRCTNYCGQFIRHGAWYPDKKIRLFDRRVAEWGGLDPHDKVMLKKKMPVHHLAGDILHYSYSTKEEHAIKNEKFSSILAQAFYNAGKKTNFFRQFINPAWAFLHGYLLNCGFLDGKNGLLIAIRHSHYVYLKHKKLYQLQKNKSFYSSQSLPVLKRHKIF